MVAAVLRFWDGEADSVGALDLLLSVLEQAAATMTVTRTQMQDLMNDFDLVRPRTLPAAPVEVLVHQIDECTSSPEEEEKGQSNVCEIVEADEGAEGC